MERSRMDHQLLQYKAVVSKEATALEIATAVLKDLDSYWPEFDNFHYVDFDETTGNWCVCFMWGNEPGGDIAVIISKNNGEIIEIYRE